MGRIIGAAAGKNIKPVTLELGGKSAAIVWKDVDVAQVAPRLLSGLRNLESAAVGCTGVGRRQSSSGSGWLCIGKSSGGPVPAGSCWSVCVCGPQAAEAAFIALQFNMGQCCAAGSRTFVHEGDQRQPVLCPSSMCGLVHEHPCLILC